MQMCSDTDFLTHLSPDSRVQWQDLQRLKHEVAFEGKPTKNQRDKAKSFKVKWRTFLNALAPEEAAAVTAYEKQLKIQAAKLKAKRKKKHAQLQNKDGVSKRHKSKGSQSQFRSRELREFLALFVARAERSSGRLIDGMHSPPH